MVFFLLKSFEIDWFVWEIKAVSVWIWYSKVAIWGKGGERMRRRMRETTF